MNRSNGVGAALLLLPLVLFAARSPGPPAERPCRDPRLVNAASGPPVEVGCGALGRPPLSGATRLLFALPLDLNRAAARDLEVLPGIGPRRAAAIVAAREERPFCRVAELERVVGIGPATRARISPLVRAGAGARCATFDSGPGSP